MQDLLTHQSSEVLAAEPGYLELLLILKLFAKLTDSCAVNGQDLLRVHLGRQQMQNTSEADTSMDDVNGSDALDLGCQIMDVISQAAEPLLELLGKQCIGMQVVRVCLLTLATELSYVELIDSLCSSLAMPRAMAPIRPASY